MIVGFSPVHKCDNLLMAMRETHGRQQVITFMDVFMRETFWQGRLGSP